MYVQEKTQYKQGLVLSVGKSWNISPSRQGRSTIYEHYIFRIKGGVELSKLKIEKSKFTQLLTQSLLTSSTLFLISAPASLNPFLLPQLPIGLLLSEVSIESLIVPLHPPTPFLPWFIPLKCFSLFQLSFKIQLVMRLYLGLLNSQSIVILAAVED